MSNYSDGVIAITAGSDMISGVGTSFLKNIKINQYLVLNGLPFVFRIKAVINDTNFQIVAPIPGLTGNSLIGIGYAVCSDFTPNISLPLSSPNDLDSLALIGRALNIIDREMIR